MEKKLIYFLCTGNSCRSQMAEGWAKHYGQDKFEVYSAGLETHGLNPRAVQVMQNAGVDISHHTSDLIQKELLNRADYVITLCNDADAHCPTVPPTVERLHWGFEDPAKALGSEGEIMAKFCEVRDAIEQRVLQFFNEIK